MTEAAPDSGGPTALALTLDPDLQARHPVIVEALAAWHRFAGAGGVPCWQGFSPSAMPARVVPHLLVVQVVATDPPRFRWRLIGTAIVKRLGRDSTGKGFEDLYQGAVYDHMTEAPLWVLAHLRPLRSEGSAAFAGKDFLTSENLFLPATSHPGGPVDRILVVSVYEPPPGTQGSSPSSPSSSGSA